MQTEIRVGEKLALVAEHADLVIADENDAALSVLEVRDIGDEFFRHCVNALPHFRWSPRKAGSSATSHLDSRSRGNERSLARALVGCDLRYLGRERADAFDPDFEHVAGFKGLARFV